MRLDQILHEEPNDNCASLGADEANGVRLSCIELIITNKLQNLWSIEI